MTSDAFLTSCRIRVGLEGKESCLSPVPSQGFETLGPPPPPMELTANVMEVVCLFTIVSCGLSWPLTCYVVKTNLDFLASTSQAAS